MPSIRTTVVFALIVAVLMALWGWSEVGRYSDLYKTEKTAREAAQAHLIRVQKATRAVEKKYATTNAELRAALAAVPDRDTPSAVYTGLCRRANCAKPGAMPTPAD